MIRNYIKIAWRNIRKNKLYSAVNIIGLTTGIAACLLIGLYIWNEVTYDNFHDKADRIAKVYMDYQYSGTRSQTDVTGTKVGPQFQRTFPQVETYVRTMKSSSSVSNGIESFEEDGILYADADFFQLFSFPLLRGNEATVLDAPRKVVLTPATARKYFGASDPIGQTLQLDGGHEEYQVTGISEAPPLNSQLQYDMLISFSTLAAADDEEWTTANYHTYLLLNNADQLAPLEQQIDQYMKKAAASEINIAAGSVDHWTYHLERLQDVHLHSAVSNSFEPNGNITYIYVLGIIAVLILLIACVNYINLATAQSVGRSTEIGIRKVMGAEKSQLWRQFLGESFVITLIASVLGLIVSIALLPLFNTITGKEFTFFALLQPQALVATLLLAILIGIISGAYPAFVLTSTKLVSILKSGIRMSNSGGLLRKSLITFQFSIAIFLVAATIIVASQLSYIQTKDLGYNREQVVVLPVDQRTMSVYEQLKQAFQNTPGVTSVTGSYEDPTSIGWGDAITVHEDNDVKQLSLNATPVDLDYLATMGMELAAGRDFTRADYALQDTSNDYANFRWAFILNESAVADLGWTPEEAIGKTINRYFPGTVVGVVKDFHFQSLHTAVGPLLIFADASSVRQLFVKINTANTAQTLSSLERAWAARVGHRPFDYHFMDEDFAALYRAESRIASLFSLFSGIAITLACLGLFALAAFTTVQRTKEIGIRKVLGASTANITMMVAKQFLVLVAVAFVIATPAAWWAGSQWLQDFAYRIAVPWWAFVLAGAFAIVIALVAVSYHTIRAAIANPVTSLRDE